MKKKLAILRSLDEARLRKDVLIPLFSQMGFKEVIEYHGPQEKGKDIIYYDLDRFGNKKYTHVVVKKGNISGSASTSSGAKEVLFQVQQGFQEPYTDIYGLKQVIMDSCLVVTSRQIKNTAIESISGHLQQTNLDKLVDFIDGPRLIELMDQHLPGYFFEAHEKFQNYFNALKADFEKIKDVSAIGQRQAILLEEIYVSLKLSQTRSRAKPEMMDRSKADKKEMAAWEAGRMVKSQQVMDADVAVENHLRLVILGAPGAGKTTLLKHLALAACKQNLDQQDRVRVPVWITLRELVNCDASCLRDYIDTVFQTYDFADARDAVEEDLQNGRCLLLLDGFDELASLENQEIAVSHIHKFVRDYPRCRVVIASRHAGYQGQLRGFSETEIMEFDDIQVEQFIQNWFGKKKREKAITMSKAIKANGSIGKLARNPLLISIIAVICEEDRELPQGRVKLYERAVEVLLSRWDKQKQLENMYKADQKQFFLEKLALFNHTHDRHIINENELFSLLYHHTGQMGLKEEDTKAFIEEMWTRSYLLRRIGPREYDFLHLSFQEYFTALELKNSVNGIDTLIEHALDPWWEEPLLLYAGLIRDAAPLIQQLEQEVPEDRFYTRLMLTGKCLADSQFTATKVMDRVVDSLQELHRVCEFRLLRQNVSDVLGRINSDWETDLISESFTFLDVELNIYVDLAKILYQTLHGNVNRDFLPALIQIMKNEKNEYIRGSAAAALGNIGDKTAVPALEEALNDEGCWRSFKVKEAAFEALYKIEKRKKSRM